MKYILGENRQQTYLFQVSLDDAVEADNEVRLIDVFVEGLKLEEFGFKSDFIENGRPAYHPADLLKLYIYGYLNRTEVAYNAQTSVDAKHNLPFDYKVTNDNDSKAMGNMLQRAKTILHSNDFTALYHKGYHTGSEFKVADELGIKVMVAFPAVAAQAPTQQYNVGNFIFDKANDRYTCPHGEIMTTNGRWQRPKHTGSNVIQPKIVKHVKQNRNVQKPFAGKQSAENVHFMLILRLLRSVLEINGNFSRTFDHCLNRIILTNILPNNSSF